MTLMSRAPSNFDLLLKAHMNPYQPRRTSLAAMKVRQSTSIREIANAVIAAGFVALDEQANALGLSRSTTWTIIKGCHKSSGLSARIINRILAARHLPPLVRARVLEYVEQKTTGHFGHSVRVRRKFLSALSIKSSNQVPPLRIVNVATPVDGASEVLRHRQHLRAQKAPTASKSERDNSSRKLPPRRAL